MAVRSSDATAGRFACLLGRGPLRGLRERRAARAQHAPKDARRAAAGSRGRAASASDGKVFTFAADSLLTAQFGVSSHHGQESLGGPTVEAPAELEVLHSFAVEEHGAPDEAHGMDGFASLTGSESRRSQAEATGVLDSARDSPDLCGVPTSQAAAGIAEYVPYLNAATNKPFYLDSPTPTSAPDSRESSFQSHGDEDEDDANADADADALSVMDCGQVAPYLEGMLTSSVGGTDVAELVPYINAVTGRPCYLDSLATALDSEGSEADLNSCDAPLTGKLYLAPTALDSEGSKADLDCSDAAPYLHGASTSRGRACPYLQ